MCLIVISKGTFQALKQLIFHYFFLDTVYIIVVRMECFFVRGGKLVVNSDDMTTDQKYWLFWI